VPDTTWDDARLLSYGSGRPLPPVAVTLAGALGCVLAADLTALTDLPAADTSAMDGWAVCGDPPWEVTGRALAGHPASRLTASRAVIIATGASVPPGTTGIVRTERGEVRDGHLDTSHPADLTDVRIKGHEAHKGDVLFPACRTVTPVVLGLAAAAGYDELTVHPRPRVRVLTLGDELLDSGPARGGAVRDALGVQLPAWVQAWGGAVGAGARVPDTLEGTLAAIRSADSDIVVTTGGSAHGAADHLRPALTALGAELIVDCVDVRPGHPMLLAALPDGRRLVGLPGNPLAALVGVVTLLQPLLAAVRGAEPEALGHALLEHEVTTHGGRRPRGFVAVPVARTPTGAIRTTGYAASSMLRGVAAAEGFVLVPPDGLVAGSPARVVWFPWTTPQ
jgi:molybdopterin molybdotransferase